MFTRTTGTIVKNANFKSIESAAVKSSCTSLTTDELSPSRSGLKIVLKTCGKRVATGSEFCIGIPV